MGRCILRGQCVYNPQRPAFSPKNIDNPPKIVTPHLRTLEGGGRDLQLQGALSEGTGTVASIDAEPAEIPVAPATCWVPESGSRILAAPFPDGTQLEK